MPDYRVTVPVHRPFVTLAPMGVFSTQMPNEEKEPSTELVVVNEAFAEIHEGGSLLFVRRREPEPDFLSNEIVRAYAPGQWLTVEKI